MENEEAEKDKTVFDLIPNRSVVKIYEGDLKKAVFIGIIRRRRIGAAVTSPGVKRTWTKRDEDRRKGRGSFTFLGFRHYWTKSRKGRWIIGRKTDRGRLHRAIQRITEWCRKNRHIPWREQHQALIAKLRGHFAYYGIPLNSTALTVFQSLCTTDMV